MKITSEVVAIAFPIGLIVTALWLASIAGAKLSKEGQMLNSDFISVNASISVSVGIHTNMSVPSCPKEYLSGHCSVLNAPVMSGVDFVMYSDSATNMPSVNHRNFTTAYNNFTFLFQNQENLLSFEKDPLAYLPQYGGFCAWAVGGETDPAHHPWSERCLGPPGDPSIWTRFEGRLFFFRYQEAKDNFLSNPGLFSTVGDDRWFGWFEQKGTTPPFNTLCGKIFATEAE